MPRHDLSKRYEFLQCITSQFRIVLIISLSFRCSCPSSFTNENSLYYKGPVTDAEDEIFENLEIPGKSLLNFYDDDEQESLQFTSIEIQSTSVSPVRKSSAISENSQVLPKRNGESSNEPNHNKKIAHTKHRLRPYKPRTKVQKRRKQSALSPIQLLSPIATLKGPKHAPDLNSTNMSLRATFLRPSAEDSNSIELEFSINGKGSHQENQQTLIQIGGNAQNECKRPSNPKQKRTLLNVWSFGNNKLKLENQREIPAAIFNGSTALNGELLNQGEIPSSVASGFRSLLSDIGRSDNGSLVNFHLPISGENLFGGNRRPNVIMLHYILWGEQETTWQHMLDNAVEVYLKNYLRSASKRRTWRSDSQKPINWREMRNVLLSFVASPNSNCTVKIVNAGNTLPEDFNYAKDDHHQSVAGRPGSGSAPLAGQKYAIQNFPGNTPVTRDDGLGYGWQQNGGWGTQPQQQQGWGWGIQEVNQGWGWGESGKKRGKKKGKKKKGKKKKGKKKKGKKKKGKKKKKKKGNSGWGDPPGWGWSPPAAPPQIQSPGWGPIQWSSFELNPGEFLHKFFTLAGVIGVPIALFVAICVVIHLITLKHKGGAGHYIHSAVHHPAPVVSPIIYNTFPRYHGWRYRTERPFDPYYGSASTHIPSGWSEIDPYQPEYTYSTHVPIKNRSQPIGTITSIKTPPMTFSEIQKSENVRLSRISDWYPRIRTQGQWRPSYGNFERRYYKNPSYDEDYEANKIHQVLVQNNSTPARTMQEEELIKILSKHKKEHIEKLLEKWKLEKMKKWKG